MIPRGKAAVLTSQTFNATQDVVQRFGGAAPIAFGFGGGFSSRGSNAFLAIITDSATLSPNRWKYAWNEINLNNDKKTQDFDSTGRRGTLEDNYAINLQEINHTESIAWGIDTNGADYPSGFAPRPIGGAGTDDSHKQDIAVIMYEFSLVGGDGAVVYAFERMGSHDGTCS